jgi:hypothetical protein
VTEFDFADCRDRLRRATEIVIDAERTYEKAIERGADAEAVYRRQLAEQFKAQRQEGKAVQEADTLARSDVAKFSRERDYAAGMLKLAAERLEDARDSRRSLWRLVEWARGRDLATPAQDGQQQQQFDARMGAGAA